MRAANEDRIVSSCVFCELVGEVENLDNLEPKDELLYLAHLKKAHGLER